MAEPGFYMPVPGEHNAPVFDPAHPSQIRRYFTQLEHLFARAALLDDCQEMKFYTTFFIDSDLATLWEAFPEFNSSSSTFDDFKTALIAIYAGYSKYTLSDLRSLISESRKSDIHSLRDLNDYDLHFQAITSDLIASGQLDSIGQTLAYPQGFPPTFWSLISQRLLIRFPEHRAIDPFPISDVYDAARFVLHSPTLCSTAPTVYAMDFTLADPSQSPFSVSAPLIPLAPSSSILDSPIYSEVSAIIKNLKSDIVSIFQAPSTSEIEPQSIVKTPAHCVTPIPSPLEPAPSKPLEIPGYEPPHISNFGSAPPRRSNPVAPPGLQAPPSRRPVSSKHTPDHPLFSDAPHFVLDTSLSSSEPAPLPPKPLRTPESSHFISEFLSKSPTVITFEELLSVAPALASHLGKSINKSSNTALVSTHHPPIAPIHCFSLEIPPSIVPPSLIIAPSSPFSALSSPIIVPPLLSTPFPSPVAPSSSPAVVSSSPVSAPSSTLL